MEFKAENNHFKVYGNEINWQFISKLNGKVWEAYLDLDEEMWYYYSNDVEVQGPFDFETMLKHFGFTTDIL